MTLALAPEGVARVSSALPAPVKLFPLAKGAVMAALLSALSVPFWQALFIAVTSAITSGTFLLIATWIQMKHTDDAHADLAARQKDIQSEVENVKGIVKNGN